MPSCLVCNRPKNKKSKLLGYTFHLFPTNQIVKEKWEEFVSENGLNVSDITNTSFICSSHFSPSVFVIQKKRRRLLKSAIPNIIISRVKIAKDVHAEISTVCKLPCLETQHNDNCNENNNKVPTYFDIQRTLVKLPITEVDGINKMTPDKKISSSSSDASMRLTINSKSSLSNVHVEKPNIQVTPENKIFEEVSLLNGSIQSNITSPSSSETSTVLKQMKSSFSVAAGRNAPKNKSGQMQSKYEIQKQINKVIQLDKKIKTLQQILIYKNEHFASLKKIIKLYKNVKRLQQTLKSKTEQITSFVN